MAVLKRFVFIMIIYPIRKAWLAALEQDKALTDISKEYINFVDVFLSNLAKKLYDYTGIINNATKHFDDKVSSYSPIYSFNLVELETLKIYIKTNLKTVFIHLFWSTARAPTIFNKKSDKTFCLYIDYRGQNNLVTKIVIYYLE